jgi:hypothetical protein
VHFTDMEEAAVALLPLSINGGGGPDLDVLVCIVHRLVERVGGRMPAQQAAALIAKHTPELWRSWCRSGTKKRPFVEACSTSEILEVEGAGSSAQLFAVGQLAPFAGNLSDSIFAAAVEVAGQRLVQQIKKQIGRLTSRQVVPEEGVPAKLIVKLTQESLAS